jgi:hypothetical protein
MAAEFSQLIFDAYLYSFSRGSNGRLVKLTIYLHLGQRLRMGGTILLLSHKPSCYGKEHFILDLYHVFKMCVDGTSVFVHFTTAYLTTEDI